MGRDMATSQDFVNWVCSEELNHNFLKYLLISESAAFRWFSSGAVHQTIYFPEVKAFHICHPSLPEQQRIVGILDEAFSGLAIAKANAERNLQNARVLFGRYLSTLFEERGKAWEQKPLREVCTLVNGRAYNQQELLDHGKYRVLRVGNFFTNNHWYYSDLELDADKFCDNGDLLYAWSASFGPRIWEGGKVIYHYHIWKVVPHANLTNKKFLFYLLEWDVDQIKQAHGTGTTMMHVSKGSMEGRIVPVAPLKEQEKMVATLDAFREETRRLEFIFQLKLTALDMLKESLLHQAFSGQL
jgi:type I restriction enzyme S subunit